MMHESPQQIEIVHFRDKRSKGFGFADLATEDLVEKAITILNGKPMEKDGVSRNLVVSKARP